MNEIPVRTAVAQSDRNATSADTRILIIEDDLSYIFLCKRYLRADKNYNHKIVSASTAKEAASVCSVDKFDCIIADYMLPDALGTTAIENLKALLGDEMPATIVFTADGGEAAASDAVRSGATDFLSKRDVNEESLCRAVNNAVEKGALRQSLTQRIQELETANELLLRRNSEIQRFYHTVSHEVKTPLTAIQEFVAIVHDGLAGEVQDEQRTILNYALESCKQISTHFNDLLELSRFETGKMVIQLSPNSIDDVFNHCVVAATPAAAAKGINLDVTNRSDLPMVLIQSHRIIQVLSNLLSNAIKFTDSGGAVNVDCQVSDDKKSLRVDVTDTGCGIKPSDQAKIFDRLYQATSPASGEYSGRENDSGMGLGLSIASQIIDLHGSKITVESELGKGTTFSFKLETCIPADSEQAA